jgi:CheY-like chemotaxis protein/anti-sigma regulatory factor (Ser/Thr protein kinase)
MSQEMSTLLVVDDTKINQVLICKYLQYANYQFEIANNGEEAWAMLQASPEKYDAVLLDRMMPGIDGMEVLRRIKKDPKLKFLPVIMQTTASTPEEFEEGMNAGAYYYLTKPYSSEVMRAVVSTALRDRAERLLESSSYETMCLALRYLDNAYFTFRTTKEAHLIAQLVSNLCPSRDEAHMGLIELMLNAVEHGNLGITYDEKTLLIAEERLHEEVDRRLSLPEYARKTASLQFKRADNNLVFTIKDEGKGFDWTQFMEMKIERMMDNHGRGIAMSRSISFNLLEYLGDGNCAVATISAG